MRRALCADLCRLYRGKWLWLCAACMAVISATFVLIQYAAMEYTVAIDRVLFLPMSFYGIAVAALVSLFIGEDFSGGQIKNKIFSGLQRTSIYWSNLMVSCIACITIYLITTLVTVGMGVCLFEINVTALHVLGYFGLGLCTSIAYASIFCMIVMLVGSRTAATATCMGLSFALLFLCLHTNQVLVQEALKNGVANPAYVEGGLRGFYAYLHDLNPCGQAAQLAAMNCLNPIRFVGADLFWFCISATAGAALFTKKEIDS